MGRIGVREVRDARDGRARGAVGLLLLALCGCRRPSPEPAPPPESAAPTSAAPTSAAPAAPAPPPPPSASSVVAAPIASAAPQATAGVAATDTTWTLTASIHRSLPPFTFALTGRVQAKGSGLHVSATDPRDIPDPPTSAPCEPRCAQRELGPRAVVVTSGAGRVQSLSRGYGLPYPAEPQALELAKTATFGKNVGAGDLALADFDGDGYLDLEVLFGVLNDGGKLYQYKQVWLFDPKSGDFREVKDAQYRPGLSLASPGCLETYELVNWEGRTAFYELQGGKMVHVGYREARTQGGGAGAIFEHVIHKRGSRCMPAPGPADRVSDAP